MTTDKLSILITDDDTYNHSALTALLLEFLPNASIDTALTGEYAIDAVSSRIRTTGHSYDLIFMDYKMPGMGGDKATTIIRQIEKQMGVHPPTIIITWSSAKHSPYLDADDWLPKPADPSILSDLLTNHGFL